MAGIFSGQVSANVGSFQLGGNLDLRINTTPGAVNETIPVPDQTSVPTGGAALPLVFASNEAANGSTPFIALTAGGASLNIGGFVTVNGTVSVDTNGNLTVTNASLFLGQGPAYLADGTTPNPTARGLLLTGVTLHAQQFTDSATPGGLDYALYATGNVSLVGVPGVSLAAGATATVQFNNSAADWMVPGIGTTVARGSRSFQGTLGLNVLGQTLNGSFTFDQATTTDGQQVLTVAFANVGVNLGPGGALTITNGSGLALLTPDGLVGQVNASIALTTTNAIQLNTASSDVSFVLNSTGSAYQNSVMVGGTTMAVNVAAGPLLQVNATNVQMTVAGQTLSGNFGFQSITTSAGHAVLQVAASNVTVALGDGTNALVDVNNGQGTFLINSAGLAGTLGGTVTVNAPGVSLRGNFQVAVNNTGAAVNESFSVGGVPVVLALAATPTFVVSGTGVNLQLLGQTLMGDFTFQQGTNSVQLTIANAMLVLTDGTNPLVELTQNVGTTAQFTLAARMVNGQFSGTSVQGSFSATALVNLSGVSFTGNFTVAIDTTDPNHQSIQATVTGQQLTVGGQVLTGNYTVQQIIANDGSQLVEVGASNVSLTLRDSTNTYVSVTNGSGAFLITSQGVAASVSATATFTVPGVTVTAGAVTVQVNTMPVPESESLNIDGVPLALQVPAGPFVRVQVIGATLTVNATGAGTGTQLTGDFAFDQSSVAGVTTTRVAIANLQATIAGQSLSQGTGALIVTSTGIAGYVSGVAAVAVNGFTAGAAIGLRFNKTGAPIDDTINLNGSTLEIKFTTGADLFEFYGSGRVTIGNFVSIEGTVTFASDGSFSGTNLNVFLGQGPGTQADGSVNPSARGVLLSGASVYAHQFATTGQYAVYATGNVQFLGIPGVSLTGPTGTGTASATVEFNNSGTAWTVPSLVPTTVVPNGTQSFQSTLGLNVLGQTLSGTFGFSTGTDASGKSIIAVTAGNAALNLGDSTTANLLTLTNGSGALLLTSAGVAGSLGGTVGLNASGVSLGGTFTVAVNTSTAAVNTALAFGVNSAATVSVPAGPYVRVTGSSVSLLVDGQTLQGNFNFEQHTNADLSKVVTVAFNGVQVNLGDGHSNLVQVTNASGTFLLNSGGIAGLAGATVAFAPGTGVSLTGSFQLAINTLSTDVHQGINLTAGTAQIDLPAGPYVQLQVNNAALQVAGQTFTGNFVIQQFTTANTATVTIAFANAGLALSAAATPLVTVTGASGALILTTGGAVGEVAGTVQVATGSGVSVTGNFEIGVNATNMAVDQTFTVNGSPVLVNLPAGPVVQVQAQAAVLTVAGQTLTADEITFQQSRTGIAVAGVNVGYITRAGPTQILSLQQMSFAGLLTPTGLAGAALGAVLTGPDASLGITVSGTASLYLNTTPTGQTFTIGTQTVPVPAATSGSFVQVVLGPTTTGQTTTPASVTVLGNSLTADQFIFQKNGSEVQVSGTNLGLLLQAGSQRILQITDASFTFQFSQNGILGAVNHATLTGPSIPGLALAGTVSLLVNTTPVVQTLSVDGQSITVPAAAPGTYLNVNVSGGTFTILGNGLTADSFTFTKSASGAQVTATNLALRLTDGTNDLADVSVASGTLNVVAAGIMANFTGSVTVNVPNVALNGSFNVQIDTTTATPTFSVASVGTGVALKLGPAGQQQTLGGNFTLQQTTAADNSQLVLLGVSNAALSLGTSTVTYVSITNGIGSLALTSQGVAASFTVTASFNVPGVMVSASTVTMQVNTAPVAVNETVTVAGVVTPIQVPAGPYLRVQVVGASITLGSGAGSGTQLTGNFAFDQSMIAGDNPITRVAVTNLQVVFNGQTLAQGSGAFVIVGSGIAGVISGQAGVASGNFSVGAEISLQFNKTGQTVNQTINLNGRTFTINFPTATDTFTFVGTGSLNLGNFVQIEATVSFSGGSTFTLSNVTLFVGQGPSTIPDGMGGMIPNPSAQGLLLTGANGSVTQGTTSGTYVLTATAANLSLVGIPGLTLAASGVSVAFDNTGAITIASVGVTSGTLSFSGQTLTGGFAFGQGTDSSGTKVLTVHFSNVAANLGSGSNLLTLTGNGDFVFTSAGLAGSMIGTINFASSAVTFGSGFGVTINTTPAAVATTLTTAAQLTGSPALTFATAITGDTITRSAGSWLTDGFQAGNTIKITGTAQNNSAFTVASLTATVLTLTISGQVQNETDASAQVQAVVMVNVPAGPYLRIAGTGTQLTIHLSATNTITLTGNFALEQVTANLPGGTDTQIRIAASNVSFSLTDGTNNLVNVTNGQGFLIINSMGGLAGSLTATVASAVPSVSLSGTFTVSFNTTGAPVNESLQVGADTITLNLPAGTFVRVTGTNLVLTVAGQTLMGNFTFEQQNTASVQTVTITFANAGLALTAGGSALVTVSNAAGTFQLTTAGLVGQALATVTVAPSTGISLGGTFALAINTTADFHTFTGATGATVTLPAGPLLQVQVISGFLRIGGFTLMADEIDFLQNATGILVSGQNLSFELDANATRIVQLQHMDFAFLLTSGGLVGAALNATINGPDPSLGVSLTGTASLLLNNTGTARNLVVAGQTVAVPASAPGTLFIQVVIGKNPDATPATLTVAGNTLSADQFVFQQDATGVAVSGTNLNFLLQAGTQRIVSISNASFAAQFTAAGVAAAVVNATVQGPALPNLTLAGTVSLLVNTTTTATTLQVAGQSVSVPAAAAGSPFVEVAVAKGTLSILGSSLTADQFTFQKSGDNVLVTATNADLQLGTGGASLADVRIASASLTITPQGVTGSFTGSVAVNVPGMQFAGSFTVTIDTVSATRSVTVTSASGATLNTAGLSLGGSFTLQVLTTSDGRRELQVAVAGLTLNIGNGVVVVSGGSGALTVNSLGVAGSFAATAAVTLPGATLTVSTVRFDINTASTPVNDTFTIGSTTTTLDLPAGPFVRVTALGAQLAIGSSLTLTGDFSFDQDASGTVRVGAANVFANTSSGGQNLTIANGQGGLVVFGGTGGGIAGVLSGDISAAAAGAPRAPAAPSTSASTRRRTRSIRRSP